jgi:outer membrane protein OmpA-like peptidoglycan-associated protein
MMAPQMREPGKRLPASVQREMEAKLGHSFEDVRVHTGPEASEAAASLNARAFTSGQQIVFDRGQYNPWSPDGRELLAHELAHTVQRPAAGSGISAPGDAGEREATSAGLAVSAGGSAEVGRAPGATIARQEYPRVMSGQLTPPSGELELQVDSPFMAAAIGSATIEGFATGKADLTTEHLGQIGMTGLRIQKLLRKFGTSTVEVTGHTDTVGEEGSNFRLGQARADAVRDKLIEAGVPAGIITANSAGEGGRQAVATKDEVGNAKNRRAEIRFNPGKSFPGIMGDRLKLDPPGEIKEQKKKSFDWDRIGPGGVKPEKIDRGPIFTDPFPPGTEDKGLPPNFWKPIPPAKPGQKSVIDVVGEKLLDPAIDDLFGWLSKDKRKWLKEKAREGVAKGVTAGVKAAAESLGVTDAKALEALEKATEAGIKYKGETPKEGSSAK